MTRCNRCHEELDQPALLLGPPPDYACTTLCTDCYSTIVELIVAYDPDQETRDAQDAVRFVDGVDTYAVRATPETDIP